MKPNFRCRGKFFRIAGHVRRSCHFLKQITKNIYGDKKSSKKGWKAKINTGADGTIFELVENAQYHHGKKEAGKNGKAHKGVEHWEYFVKTVQIDGRVYDLLANVRKKPDGEYVYSIQLNENNKISASPVAVTAESNPALNVGEADNSSVAYNSLTVKQQFSFSEPVDAVFPTKGEWTSQEESMPREVSRTEVKKEVQTAKKEFQAEVKKMFASSDGKKKAANDIISSLAEKIRWAGKVDAKAVNEACAALWDTVMVTPEEVLFEDYRVMRDQLGGYRVYVPDAVKHEFSDDWNSVRATISQFGKGV